jgi:hypothetical protein
MPFNGSGKFVRSYSWVTDQANSIQVNATRMDADSNDIANGLSSCVTKDGQSGALTANLQMGSNKITGLASGSASTDAVNYGQVFTSPTFSSPTLTVSAVLPTNTTIGSASSAQIQALSSVTPTELGYVSGVTSAIQTQISAKAPIASPTFTGIVTVPTPTNSTDAVTKGYADALAFTAALPSQTGNSGKTVTTDGTAASWSALKTINGASLLGTGDVALGGGSTTTSSAVDITLTSASTRVQVVTMTAANTKITLPDATTLSTGGALFVVTNAGALNFAVRANGGGLLGNILPSQTAVFYLTNNSTAAGVWAVSDGTSNGVFSTPLPGTVTSVNAATTNGVSITSLSSTLALIVYRQVNTIFASTLTISGTTITVNAALTVTASGGGVFSVIAVSATQAVVCYSDGSANTSACTLNISGATVSAGTAIVLLGANAQTVSIAKRSSTEVAVCVGYTATNVSIYPVSISGTTLTGGTSASIATQDTTQSFTMLSSTLGVFSSHSSTVLITRYSYVTFSGTTATIVGTYTYLDNPPTAADTITSTNCTALTATKFLAAGAQMIGSQTPAIRVWLGDSQNNTGGPSFAGGITVAYAKDNTAAPKIQRITDTTAMLTWMGSAGFIYACEISVNGSTLTAGPVVALNAVASSAPAICSLSATAQVVAFVGTSSFAQAVVLENA